MADTTFFIDRQELERVFNPRAAKLFEDMQRRVAETEETVTAGVDATDTLQEASFVTLSPNAELQGEYVLSVGDGLRLVTSPGGVALLSDAPRVDPSDFSVTFAVTGNTNLALPLAGIVATRENAETFKNKTLDAPALSGLVNAADDTAAAAADVPVGGVYRNGSVLMLRVA